MPALLPFVNEGSRYTAYTFTTEARIRSAATQAITQNISYPGLVV